MNEELLSILRCPVTQQKLRFASVAEKLAHDASSDDVALITEDGKYFYRSENGIPILLPPQDLVIDAG